MRADHSPVLLILAVVVGWLPPLHAEDTDSARLPEKYILNYPTARRSCPPIRSTFTEVTQSFLVVRNHRFTQQLNGGYGLPIVDKVGDKNLLHVGADLGWHQVGEPVFAIADGVVRISEGPRLQDAKTAPRENEGLRWGNLVVLEHRFGEQEYYTSIYGHLGVDRRVHVGDIVTAGQMIGTIGRQHASINGGYKPHVHLGIRTGRMAEIGAMLFTVRLGGERHEATITDLDEEFVSVSLSGRVRLPMKVSFGGQEFEVWERAGKSVLPARVLWLLERPDFGIVGYSLTRKGWEDPVAFLRRHQADTNPAPLRAAK